MEGKQTLEKTQERRREGGEDLAREISNINKRIDFLFYLSKKCCQNKIILNYSYHY